ncbi:MAG: SRPBCC family protein [Gammaproteobacteria bacterium]
MNSQASDRQILKTVMVEAPVEQVWEAWTTENGLQSFFARRAIVELQTDGRYELLFFPENPEGQRGEEGARLLAIEPDQRLVFTWSAPPNWPRIREMRTVVEVTLSSIEEGQTEVRLRHTLWGDGPDWDEVFTYFDGAWSVVLKRLAYRFEQGPVDWDDLAAEYRFGG